MAEILRHPERNRTTVYVLWTKSAEIQIAERRGWK